MATGPHERLDAETLARQVDALLPQTQCTRCGFDACRPYAQAIARGEADINRCPPGGAAGIERLARLTGRPVVPLDPACGSEQPRAIAWIDPRYCIGCTLCIQACPVDAVVGASKALHAVLEAQCTGCELCIPPCPVDCIEMRPLEPPVPWTDDDAAAARRRHDSRALRLAQEAQRRDRSLTLKAQASLPAPTGAVESDGVDEARKRALIASAIAKARARLAAR